VNSNNSIGNKKTTLNRKQNIVLKQNKPPEAAEKKEAEKQGRDVETLKYPTMIFVKPPKKKREEKLLTFARLNNGDAVNKANVANLTEKISGGTTYHRQKLPDFIKREKAKKREEL
jgi:hypothetical protein